MADYGDTASKVSEQHRQLVLDKAKREAASIEQGIEGDCDLCGEYFTRIVFRPNHGHLCGKCRDELRVG